MIIYTIYKITNKINNKSYIGFTSKSISSRYSKHLYDAKHREFPLYKAMRKYGIDSFYIESIYQSKDEKHTHKIMEAYFIQEYNTYKNGYNASPGGDGRSSGYKQPEWVKKKISQGLKKSNHPIHGGNHSTNSVEKMKGKRPHVNQTGKNNNNFQGWYHTPWGVYESSILASENCPEQITHSCVNKWCKKPDKQISKSSITKSEYLLSQGYENVGSTFREIGFSFTHI